MQDPQQAVDTVATTVGYCAFVLLWLGMVLGIVLRDGWAVERIRPATLASIHQTVSSCGLTLALTHAFTQLAVPGGPTRLIDEFVPFTHREKPLAVGLGVIAMYLMIALSVSVVLRRRMGYHSWRVLHRFGYLAFAVLVAHVVLAGVGRRSGFVLAVVGALGVATVGFGLATAGWVSRLPSRLKELAETGWRGKGQRATIQVDATRCVHFGFCQHEAPDLFEVRDDGRLDYAPTVGVDRMDAAIRAARACPTRAIMLSRHAVRVVLADPPAEDAATDGPHEGDTGVDDGSSEHASP